MPRVHTVQKARKPIPHANVNVGDTYYWWKFRYGGRQVSKTYPRRSQLTQSDFLAQKYDLEDEISAISIDDYMDDAEGLQNQLQEFADRIRELGEEQEEKRMGMPEQLQESGMAAETLMEYYDGCNEWADALEGITIDPPERQEFPHCTDCPQEEDVDKECDECDECQEGQEEWRDAIRSVLESALEEASCPF